MINLTEKVENVFYSQQMYSNYTFQLFSELIRPQNAKQVLQINKLRQLKPLEY